MIFLHKGCPSCGATGRCILKGVWLCVTCHAVYTEFGLIIEGNKGMELS